MTSLKMMKATNVGFIYKIVAFTALLIAFAGVFIMTDGGHALAANYPWTYQPGTTRPDGTPELQIPQSQTDQLAPCVNANGLVNGVYKSNALAVWLAQDGTPSQQDPVVTSGTTSITLEYDYAGVVCRAPPAPLGSREFRSEVMSISSQPAGTTITGLRGIISSLPFSTYPIPGCQSLRGCYIRTSQGNIKFSKAGGFTTTALYTINIIIHQINQYADGHYECINPETGAGSTAPVKVVAGWGDIASCPDINANVGVTVHVTSNPVNHPPKSDLNLTCNYVTPLFNDEDGSTTADLYKNGVIWKRNIPSTASGTGIDISSLTALGKQSFYVVVNDNVPAGTTGVAPVTSSVKSIDCSGGHTPGGPTPILTCSSGVTDPDSPQPNQNFSANATYTYSVAKPTALSAQSVTITGPDFNQTWSGTDVSVSTPSAVTATTGSVTLSLIPPVKVTQAGDYELSWSLTNGTNVVTCSDPVAPSVSPNGPNGPGHPFSVAFEPYLQAYNGDVVVGGGVPNISADGTPDCTVENAHAGIASWNTRTDSNYSGAGSQYAARALNDIFDFATSYTVSGGSGAGRPIALSFANAGTDETNGKFGTTFKSSPSGSCDTQLVSSATDVISGDNTLSDDLKAANITLPITGQHTLYLSGNVYIDTNVTYQTDGIGGYGSMADIPSFRLVVLGKDISIGGDIKELDGSYNALPSTSGGGNIYTCSHPDEYGQVSAINDENNYTRCQQQLVVNGSLTAKQIWFLRSCGTVTDSSADAAGPVYTPGSGGTDCSDTNHAAEVINMAPEGWLAPVSNTAGIGNYDAVQNLPRYYNENDKFVFKD